MIDVCEQYAAEFDILFNQGWPVAFTGGICHRYLPVNTGMDNTPKVAFTGIYKYFIDFSLNYIVDSPTYSLIIHGHHSTIFAAYA